MSAVMEWRLRPSYNIAAPHKPGKRKYTWGGDKSPDLSIKARHGTRVISFRGNDWWILMGVWDKNNCVWQRKWSMSMLNIYYLVSTAGKTLFEMHNVVIFNYCATLKSVKVNSRTRIIFINEIKTESLMFNNWYLTATVIYWYIFATLSSLNLIQ